MSIAGPLSKISGGPSVGFTADASVWTLYSRRGSGENWLSELAAALASIRAM